MTLYADVIIDLSVDKLDKPYTYIIPEALQKNICIGSAVKVSFGRLIRTGYIVGMTDTAPIEAGRLKEIISLSGETLGTEKELIELAAWMSRTYGSTMSRAISTVMPVRDRIAEKSSRRIYLSPEIGDSEALIENYIKKRRIAWVRLLKELSLRGGDGISYENAIHGLKLSKSQIGKMIEEGCIELRSRRSYRGIGESFARKDGFELNSEQKACVDEFIGDYERGNFNNYLLYGITGSGKTEVYIELIRHVLSKGRQAIVLVPEISLTYQSVKRLIEAFGDRVGLINSRQSKGERFDQFERARSGEADIMIGPRSAVFTPFDNTGIIIVDEEHDGAYKNENVPRYHTRDVAIQRAKLCNAPVLLASATPSMESYKAALEGRLKLMRLKSRAAKDALPAKTHIIDLREELKSGNRSIFARALRQAIEERLGRGEQIMLFMNRRGYSNFISCRSCGAALKCPHCDVSLTLHNDGLLHCHYCGHTEKRPEECPSCGSPYIAAFGTGTQKLEQLTAKAFPEARILRLDMDTVRGKNSARDILKKFAAGEADILIGTQMIVKGHDFPNVTLMGIMAADTSLYIDDYAAAERTFQLITQAAGRAGRADRNGDVFIQTYNPGHYAISTAAAQNYEEFYKKEAEYRELMKYPPFIRLMTVMLSGLDEERLKESADTYCKIAGEILEGGELIGPVKPAVYKIHDFYRLFLYIKHSDYDILIKIKDKLENALPEKISAAYDFG